MIKKHNTI